MKNSVFLALFLLLNGCLSSKESELINVNSKQLLDIVISIKIKRLFYLTYGLFGASHALMSFL